MSIIRNPINFADKYVQIPNHWMRDKRLSHRARGILAEIMTHSNGWEITSQHLVNNGTEGRDAVRVAIRELVEHGYLKRVFDRGEGGKATGSHYELQIPPNDGFPGDREPAPGGADFQAVGNPGDREPAPKNTSFKNTNVKNTTENTGAADADAQEQLAVIDTTPEWDVVAKLAYDATDGALPYMGMRTIAKWAIDKKHRSPKDVEQAIASLWRAGRAVTKQTVGQVLDGIVDPSQRGNPSATERRVQRNNQIANDWLAKYGDDTQPRNFLEIGQKP